jgi:hypothetical protein
MDKEDIIRMAREAGIIYTQNTGTMLERFAALVAAHEREARGHEDCKPALQKALSALDSAYYILKIQPVTPEQEADTVALAIQSVTQALEKLG